MRNTKHFGLCLMPKDWPKANSYATNKLYIVPVRINKQLNKLIKRESVPVTCIT